MSSSDSEKISYKFISSSRRGLSGAISITNEELISRITNGTERPRKRQPLDVKVLVDTPNSNDGGAPVEIETSEDIFLYGPCDVNGFDPRIVVGVEPKPDYGDFKPNYFPFIEFAEADFPWRFTPAVPNDVDEENEKGNLVPWITLIVLEDTELVELTMGDDGKTPSIIIDASAVLPDLSTSWQWAHVQITSLGEDEDIDEICRKEPERVVSRILCPRKLKPSTKYHVFVVPVFKIDDNDCDRLDFSWNDTWKDIGPLVLPYYHKWSFGTGDRGDFEHLVRLMKPRKITGVGYRSIDSSDPGYDFQKNGENEQAILQMEGALKSFEEVSDANEMLSDYHGFIDDLINPDEVNTIIRPPIYGKNHGAGSPRYNNDEDSNIENDRWSNFLNLDPRHRIAAGLGVKVVQEHQEALMGSAWEYMGEMEKINRMIRGAQVGLEVSKNIYNRVTAIPDDERFLSLTAPLFDRTLVSIEEDGSELKSSSVSSILEESPIPNALFDPAFKRIIRRRGLTCSRINRVFTNELISQLNDVNQHLDKRDMIDFCSISKDLIDNIDKHTPERPNYYIPLDIGTCSKITIDEDMISEFISINNSLKFFLISRPKYGNIMYDNEKPTSRKEFCLSDFKGPLEYCHNGDNDSIDTIIFRCESDSDSNDGDEFYIQIGMVVILPEEDTDDNIVSPGETYEDDTVVNTIIDNGAEGHVYQYDINNTQNLLNLKNSITETRSISYQLQNSKNGSGYMGYKPFCPNIVDQLIQDHITSIIDTWSIGSSDSGDVSLLDIESLRSQIETKIDPETTITDRIKRRFKLNDTRKRGDGLFMLDLDLEFPQPMYKPLMDLSQEYIAPGLDKVPSNSIGILRSNERFIQAYMCGLSHEFSSELQWRKCPVRRDGTYFRQFWDAGINYPTKKEKDIVRQKIVNSIEDENNEDETYLSYLWLKETGLEEETIIDLLFKDDIKKMMEPWKDIKKITDWGENKLGSQDNRPTSPFALSDCFKTSVSDRIVVVLKGDLLRRYPNTATYMIKTKNENDEEKPDWDSIPILPIFEGTLPPDTSIMMFNMTEADAWGAYGDGYFFVIEERVSETRFGLDISSDEEIVEVQSSDDLSWVHIQNDNGGSISGGEYIGNFLSLRNSDIADITDIIQSASGIAKITMQKPVRIVIPTKLMLPPINRTG